jgi:hypothetical protein
VSRPALGSTQPPVQWIPRVLSPGVKRGRGVSRSYTSSPPSAFVACSGQLYFRCEISASARLHGAISQKATSWKLWRIYFCCNAGKIVFHKSRKLRIFKVRMNGSVNRQYDVNSRREIYFLHTGIQYHIACKIVEGNLYHVNHVESGNSHIFLGSGQRQSHSAKRTIAETTAFLKLALIGC